MEGPFIVRINDKLIIESRYFFKAEQSSVAQLQTLLTRTIEAISFVLLLNDYRLGDLIAQ